METNHRKRCQRYDVPGDAHFLTFSCFKRLPLLSKPRSCEWILDAIGSAREAGCFELWAYVIMPEHVHLVIRPNADASISQILNRLKQSVSKRAILWLKEHASEFLPCITDEQPNGKRHVRFWQRGGGYDRNLRSVRDIHEKIRYVHENPVRRGLVTHCIDWSYSSARAWETNMYEPLPIDRHSVPSLTILDDQIQSDLFL